MRLLPSDPNIRTLVGQIKDGDIDLQPDFQRGEVWPDAKKRRLIDSILRDWHVPPIHVVEIPETGKHEVLDGKQRLVAIRDFANGELTIDGYVEPISADLQQLHGLTYTRLPEAMRRRFDNFPIRMFRIVEYDAAEPGELFYRLNQPTRLTSAEQRNAFYGAARQQVKDLVQILEKIPDGERRIGFSNARMSWDDVVARVCVSLEHGTLNKRVRAAEVADFYRSDRSFAPETVAAANNAMATFAATLDLLPSQHRFNKATLYSWLIFICSWQGPSRPANPGLLAQFIERFESRRIEVKSGSAADPLLGLFNEAASSRVSDTTSVLLRDFVLWHFFLESSENRAAFASRVALHDTVFSRFPNDGDAQRTGAWMLTLGLTGWGAFG